MSDPKLFTADNPPAPSETGSAIVSRSVYAVPKMDCPAEEQMVRLALKEMASIRDLGFDLDARMLTVWHSLDAALITERLIGTGLGARLLQTTPETDPAVLTQLGSAGDRDESRVLWVLLSINAFMFFVEIIAGWLAESTGLIADSLDMFADAGVYGLSLYAVGRAPFLKVRAAHMSGWFQFALAVGALMEVVRRFVFGSDPQPPFMVSVAAVALVANVSCLMLLARHRHGGAHMKASWIFSTNDVIANLCVIAAGVLVSVSGSRVPDLIVGSVIGGVVLSGAIRILKLR